MEEITEDAVICLKLPRVKYPLSMTLPPAPVPPPAADVEEVYYVNPNPLKHGNDENTLLVMEEDSLYDNVQKKPSPVNTVELANAPTSPTIIQAIIPIVNQALVSPQISYAIAVNDRYFIN